MKKNIIILFFILSSLLVATEKEKQEPTARMKPPTQRASKPQLRTNTTPHLKPAPPDNQLAVQPREAPAGGVKKSPSGGGKDFSSWIKNSKNKNPAKPQENNKGYEKNPPVEAIYRKIRDYNKKHVESPYMGYPITSRSVALTFQVLEVKKSVQQIDKRIEEIEFQLKALENAKTNPHMKKEREKSLQEQLKRCKDSKQKEQDKISNLHAEILREHERYIQHVDLTIWVEPIHLQHGHPQISDPLLEQQKIEKSNTPNSFDLAGIVARINSYNREHGNDPYHVYPLTAWSASLTYQLLESRELIHHMAEKIAGYKEKLHEVREAQLAPAIKQIREEFWLERIRGLQDSQQKEQTRAENLLADILKEHERHLKE